MSRDAIAGCLLGTAVGDAIGLPYEGLSRRRAERMLGPPDRHRLVLGRGMVSDDTEHTCMVAQSLITSGGDPNRFASSFAWRLRWWLLGLPAGMGLATLRSIVRLWMGFPPQRSGVNSAGNGAAMRSAIFGAALEDQDTMRQLVSVSTRITHSDPKAKHGAWAVALAANTARRSDSVAAVQFADDLQASLSGEDHELVTLVRAAAESVNRGDSTRAFADSIGQSRGVSGYVFHTVPVALHAWFTHPRDYRSAVMSVIRCGGDTDTTAAIVGGIVGTAVGRAGIPDDWLTGLAEWPRTVSWMEQLASELDMAMRSNEPARPVALSPWSIGLRNSFFILVVLFHALRRLLPPY